MNSLVSNWKVAAGGTGALVLTVAMLRSGGSKEKSTASTQEVAAVSTAEVSNSTPVNVPSSSSVPSFPTPAIGTPPARICTTGLRVAAVSCGNLAPVDGPFSQGMKSGGFLYTSGLVGTTADGDLESGSMKKEAAKALENLGTVLKASNCTEMDVVRTTVYLTDLNDTSAVHQAFEEFFGEHKPASTVVQVQKLQKEAKIGIDAVARLQTRHVE